MEFNCYIFGNHEGWFLCGDEAAIKVYLKNKKRKEL